MAPAPPKRSAADARRDQVAALARSGMAGPAIAAALGLSIRTVWSDAAARRVSLGGSGGPSRRAEVYALAEKGMIGAQIARETGMTPSSVSKYLAQWRAGK
jgi:DNA-binding NarL/FixJ family response regulator